MNNGHRSIFYADGDRKSADAVPAMLHRTDVPVIVFGRVADCLESIREGGCLLLVTNIQEPAAEGLELLRKVKRIAPRVPVIVLIEAGQIDTAVRAMKAGAKDCFARPLDQSLLLSAANLALRPEINMAPSSPLTEAQKVILHLILQGKTNWEIAAVLHRSRRTVEVHRGNIMKKLGAHSIVDLFRKTALLGDQVKA